MLLRNETADDIARGTALNGATKLEEEEKPFCSAISGELLRGCQWKGL